MNHDLLAASLIVLLAVTLAVYASDAGVPGKQPVYAFCGVGDNLWNYEVEPVDSTATIEAMFEWMADTYKIRRMYWREEQIWDKLCKIGRVHLETYDWHVNWKSYLINEVKIHQTAVAAAHKNNMEIFFYFGLFEHGVQPDVGVICPYLFEDTLRIEHPEWCPLDRWGERRSPGPLSFCYPEVRKILVDRYTKHLVDHNYDGINFYTYVENLGIRYLDEFGFEQPIVDEFSKVYPGINLRQDTLTQEQKLYWYDCRGQFVTQFLRELRTALAPHGKKISMILDAKNPDYAQPWWGHEIPGTGMIRMDWQTWVGEGLIDEIWVQLADSQDQMKTMTLLLDKCKEKPIKFTLRTPSPFDSQWIPYVDAGVTPIAVITWARNGIERYCLEPTSAATLQSPDWKLRAQTLDDIAQGKLAADPAAVAPLTQDPHVLVRRKAMYALAKLADPQYLSSLEDGLFDTEASVCIAAANALTKFHGPQTPQRIMDALEKYSRFQFKIPCVAALGNMQESLPLLLPGLKNPNPWIREVSLRALYKLGKNGLIDQVYDPIRSVMLDTAEEYQNRAWAVERLVGLRYEMNESQRNQFLADLNRFLGDDFLSSIIQHHCALGLHYMVPLLTPEQKTACLDTLKNSFLKYGDACSRDDAAYGWRIVGNAMMEYGQPGKNILEACRIQTQDKWLAWLAYEVMYSVQKNSNTFCLVDEKEAVENHKKYAPLFPGWRPW